ncbi:MAG: hypothetical protein KF861_10845 [Planctomycetaceae bacterium]|nr:hypothetical protein [Planctomycetaceae bacterium]
MHRQYRIVNPLLLALIAAFHRFDDALHLFNPQAREELYSRRKRNRHKSSPPGSDSQMPTREPSSVG